MEDYKDNFKFIKRARTDRPIINMMFLYRDGSYDEVSSQDWSDIEDRVKEEEQLLATYVFLSDFDHYHYSEKYGWYRARYTRSKRYSDNG